MDQQDSQIATTASLSCSKSCARAGLFALGLSFLAFVLIPPLNKLDELKAYADYLNLRFQLTNIIDTLDNDMAFDNCWRNLMSGEDHIKDVMQWDLFELLKVRCTSQGEIKFSRPSRKEEGRPSTPTKQLPATSLTPEPKFPLNNSKTKKPDNIPPAPPTNLTVGPSSLKGLEELEEILRSLNNAQMLKSASLLSLTTMKQIADWTQERQRMFVANYSSNYSFEKINEIRRAKELSNDDQDIWVYFLTLENIKTLQKSNLPTIENWENVQKPYSLFKIPLIQVELNLGLATTLIEFAIFISVAYFWIFLREGKNISGPLAPGTLLSAMRRDRFSFSLFVLFALIPMVASLGLAFSSRHAAKIFFISLDWVFANSTFLFSSLVVWELLLAKKRE